MSIKSSVFITVVCMGGSVAILTWRDFRRQKKEVNKANKMIVLNSMKRLKRALFVGLSCCFVSTGALGIVYFPRNISTIISPCCIIGSGYSALNIYLLSRELRNEEKSVKAAKDVVATSKLKNVQYGVTAVCGFCILFASARLYKTVAN